MTARLVAAALALGVAAPAAAGAASKVIGHGAQVKGTKVWYAHAVARAPKSIAARVVPQPAQAVKVQWSVVCQKPNKVDPAIQLAPSEKAGQAVVHRSATVALALPYAKAPTCVASVYATLARTGRLTLELLGS